MKSQFVVAIIILIIVLAMVLYFMFSQHEVKHAPNAAWNETHTGFYVDGTRLMDVNGNEFVMRGINSAHCWFKDKDEIVFDAIAKTGANSIRIVCACGEKWDADTKESLYKLIDDAYKRNMIAILELHDGTGDNHIETLTKIADFWCANADVFKGTEDKCIINIANEWYGSWLAKDWRDGYTKVIPMLRNAGIKNTLMVDAGGWGQNGGSIEKYGMDVFNSDVDKNTMFSIHMYGMSGGSASRIRKNLEGVTNQNLCVCVGEFGYKHSDGEVDEDYIMEYCTQNNIGYLPWSWMGNGGGVEYLDLAKEWDGSILSTEWGERVINGVNGIRETSKLCSIFTGKENK